MMLAIKIPYETNYPDIINNYVYNYTGLYYKMYNNAELMADRTFIDESLNEYIDKSIYDFCISDVKNRKSQLETSIKKKKKEINDIVDDLNKGEFKSKKEKRIKYNLIKKLNYKKKSLYKDICFGGKGLLTKITKMQNTIKNIKLFDSDNKDKLKQKQDLLLNYKQKFSNKRNMGVYLVGRACEYGNRKVKFDFYNNTLIFKPNKKTNIEIKICPDKKYYKTLRLIQEMINKKEMPVTVRIDNSHIHIYYDEELLHGFAFNKKACKKEQSKLNTEQENKDIYKKHIKEQEERKLKGKIKKRYMAVDLNPHFIGFSIVDKINDKGDMDVIFKGCIDISKLSNKLKKSSSDKKQLKQNNKRKHEIAEVWKYLFKLAKHYKVAHFVMEDLDFKPKNTKDKSKEFNRKTKNIWHRTLTTNLINKYCNICGIIKIEVNPCYSSFIGNMIYGDYDPISASLEINRRGIIKYIKGSSIYPDITRINQEKLIYLLGENIEMNGMTWVKLYGILSLTRYRNLSKDKLIDTNLYSIKSKVKILQ